MIATEKSADAYRTIGEVADALKLPQHVLRFWETRFPQVKPLKRGGGRRFYRPEDVDLLRAIKVLLYGDGYTIKGVQRLMKDQGPRAVANLAARGGASAEGARPPAPSASDVGIARGSTPLSPGERQAASASPSPVELGEGLRAILAEIEACERILAEAAAP